MLPDEVDKLSPFERLVYWIRERTQIFLKRKAGLPKPWTDDPILQTAFFTNPFRENDRVTVWFRDNIRTPASTDPVLSIFTTIAFRWFNLPETGQIMLDNGLLTTGWSDKITKAICNYAKIGGKVFTGAFMIVMPSSIGGKAEAVCNEIALAYKDRQRLTDRILKAGTLEGAHRVLVERRGIGGFMGYEMVSDMRHTVLTSAPDINTWCHLGPGAIWGMARALGTVSGHLSTNRPKKKRVMRPDPPPLPPNYKKILIQWREEIAKRLRMPHFEMRDLEHSCCEYGKFENYRAGAKPRRRYNGKT